MRSPCFILYAKDICTKTLLVLCQHNSLSEKFNFVNSKISRNLKWDLERLNAENFNFYASNDLMLKPFKSLKSIKSTFRISNKI
jgi:hypothetical protein